MMLRKLGKISKDAASTIVGVTLAAATGAAGAYMNGGIPPKEVVVASAIFGAVGYLHNRGNAAPLVK